MSLQSAAAGLLLVDAGEGRRVALALTRPARIEKIEARHPDGDAPPEVAIAAGRVVAARSLSDALGWRGATERLGLDFGDACLLLPGALSVTLGATIEAAGRIKGQPSGLRRFWWRAPDGAIVEVLDPVKLAGAGEEKDPS